MLFKMMILVCSVALPHADCLPETALDVIEGPDVENELMCGLHGQAFLASTALATNVAHGEYMKISCMRTSIGRRVG